MEPGNPTNPRNARRWKVLVAAAILHPFLLLMASHASSEPGPPNPYTVNKCVLDGITTYSDKPCPDSRDQRPLGVDSPPSLSTILADPLRLPSRIRSARCNAAETELHDIEILTKQGQPPDMQAFLEARRQQKRNELFRYRC